MDKINYLNYLICLVVLTSCTHKAINNSIKKEPSKIDSSKTIKSDINLNIHKNVVNEDSLPPYNKVHYLMNLLERHYNTEDVIRLDSICSKSDGDLTEEVNQASETLFFSHLNEFTGYLLDHPKSFLQKSLIEAIGGDYYVYDKNDRVSRLTRDCDSLINEAKKKGVSTQKINFIKDIYKKVNPNELD